MVIAEGTKVPSGYLSKVLQSLVRSNLIRSQRGLYGGFVLFFEPEELTVLQILEAVDCAPARIINCPLGLKNHIHLCPLHQMLDEAISHAEKAYSSTTLKSLCASAVGEVGYCGYAPTKD